MHGIERLSEPSGARAGTITEILGRRLSSHAIDFVEKNAKGFPASWFLGDHLSAALKKEGFSEPRQVSAGMLTPRSELKLQSKIYIVDASGMRL